MSNPTGPKFHTDEERSAYFSDLGKRSHERRMQVSREALELLGDLIAEARGRFTPEQHERAMAIIRRGSKNIA